MLAALLLPGNLLATSVPVTFRFQAGKSAVAGGSMNASAGAELQSLLDEASRNGAGKICIRTFSSPEGKKSWNARLAEKRSESVLALLKEKWPGLPDSLVVVENVAEDWKSVVNYVRSVDAPWKDDALTLIRKGGDDLEERLLELWGGVAWDDLLWNCFTRIRRTEISLDFSSNTRFSQNGAEEAKSSPLLAVFPVGKTDMASVQASFKENLSSFVKGLPSGAKIELEAWSSPEGKVSWNRTLARRRAESVRQLLISLGVPADRITVSGCEENWRGLRASVEESYFGADKDEILAIMDNASLSADERKSALEALSSGSSWNRLIAHCMQSLRCVSVSSVNE